MEILKNNDEESSEKVLSPESRKRISDATNLVGQFFKLEKPHKTPQDSITRIASDYNLPKSDIKDLVAETMLELAAVDAKEADLIKEAREKGEKYKNALNEIQSNI